MHLAEEVEGAVQEDYKSAPMLGLVEKPKKREEIKEEVVQPKRVPKKPANRNPRKQLPPNKPTINDEYYPRRQQRTTPKTKSDWVKIFINFLYPLFIVKSINDFNLL